MSHLASERDSPIKKRLTLARERFKLAQEADKDQRARENEDIAFFNGDQWPDDVKNARKAQKAGAGVNGMPPVPARPMITINKSREPVRQVLNQERAADMGIEIVPADDFGDLTGPIDETEIQLREGLTRRIQRDSQAADARTWAFARAVQAGRGYYSVMTRYVPGKTRDQEIYIHRYHDQSCVLLDPAHEQPDGSDAEWGFEVTDIERSVYVAEYPKRKGKDNAVCAYGDSEWMLENEQKPGWFYAKDGVQMVRVANYWYTERESRELVAFALESDPTQERVEWADEVEGAKAKPDLVAALTDEGWFEIPDSRRTVVEKSIKWCKFDGCDDDVLDETDWQGPDMPIVKVLGEELQPSDHKRFVEGMVRNMRSSGYGYNVMVSRLIELIGLAPLVPLLVEEGTIEGYEEWYLAANTRTLPYLPWKRKNLHDQEATPPTVPASRNPPIDAVAASLQIFNDGLQSTSSIHASALGQAAPSVRSKRQNEQLIEQSQQGTNHFLDNLKRSMEYEAKIINNLLYPIYGKRPGRIARIVNGEGEPEHVMIGRPMLMQNGRPMPAPEGSPNAKKYTLTKDAKFNVAIKVSPQKDTKRQQENQTVGELIAANPELMTWFGDLYFLTMDGPGHQQMADRAKVMLAPPIQQMLAAKSQGQDPQAVAALAQKDAQIQAMQAELEKAGKPTAVEEIRQAATTEREAADLAFQREKMQADNETKIAVAELGAKIERLALFLEERARVGVQAEAARGREHDLGMAAVDQAGSMAAAEAERAHEAAEAEAGREAARVSQTQAEQAAAEQAERAAAMAQNRGPS